MNNDPRRAEMTGIDFYLRKPEASTSYPLRQRMIDAWTGLRDASRLSTRQAAPEPKTGEPVLELPPLTNWAHGVLKLVHDVCLGERIVHNMACDNARRDIAILARIIEASDTDKAQAENDLAQTQAGGPDPAAPSGPGEVYAKPETLKLRRNSEFQARLAKDQAKINAAEAAAKSARERTAELMEKIALADEACQFRIQRYRALGAQRLDVYARALSKRHPDALIIQVLATSLDDEHNAITTDPPQDPPEPDPYSPLRPV